MMQDDFDMDEPMTCTFLAESIGARHSLVVLLAKQGLIKTVPNQQSDTGEPVLPRRALMQLRSMQRLHRDLGVNFAGASIILELVERIAKLNRELNELRSKEALDASTLVFAEDKEGKENS